MEEKLLLKPQDLKPSFRGWIVEGAFNPGAVRLPNKKIVMYARIAEAAGERHKKCLHYPIIISRKKYKINYEKIPKSKILKKGKRIILLKDGTYRLPTISYLKRIILDESGFDIEKIEEGTSFAGKPRESDYGVEDPRITKIGKKYYMTYVGVSVKEGISTYLAESTDLKRWERKGLIFREQNKDVALFPQKIKGKYVALNRPESAFEFSKPGIWLSYSPDLIYWGKDKKIILPREKSFWENERIGTGPPPMKTRKGWLVIYHGVKKKGKKTYYAGAVLLDLKNPERIVARTPLNKPLFVPSAKYEKEGFVNRVVFPTAIVRDLNGKDLLIYSGGADKVLTVRKIPLKSVFRSMRFH
jgi:predicted GH43/DUF377 family glycosyl hydrolase